MENSNQNSALVFYEEYFLINPDDESYTEENAYQFFDKLVEDGKIDCYEPQSETRDMGAGQEREFWFYMNAVQRRTAGWEYEDARQEFCQWLQAEWEQYTA